MPELPEVETMVRGIRPFVEGRVIKAITEPRCLCKPITLSPTFPEFQARITGQKVASVNRRAKRCVMTLSSGEAIVIEPRMTGLLLLSDPPDPEHLRLKWTFNGRREFNALWFWDRRGLGTVRLHSPAELSEVLGPGKLGCDGLEMTEDAWWDQCQRTNRAIKVAMLDQKMVAGIGNLYASEILHRAGIHPAEQANRLTRKQIAALTRQTREVLDEAIRYEGSTLGDGTYRNALNQTGSFQNAHRVYKRAGEICGNCQRGVIERSVQAQRATFHCPVCQKRKRRPKSDS